MHVIFFFNKVSFAFEILLYHDLEKLNIQCDKVLEHFTNVQMCVYLSSFKFKSFSREREREIERERERERESVCVCVDNYNTSIIF